MHQATNAPPKSDGGLALSLARTRAGAAALTAWERLLYRIAPAPTTAQVFIFGLPRTGTTLVYQYLVHRFAPAFLTEAAERCPGAPAVVSAAQRRRAGTYRSSFQSRYGEVDEYGGPHEAGRVWGRLTGYHEYVTPDDISARRIRRLRRLVACTQWLQGGRPFVNKNVKHVLRLAVLREALPDAWFVVVDRDWGDVALSVLRGRYANLGRGDVWWSVRPPGWESLTDRSPAEQVAGQVRGVASRLRADLERWGADRVLRIDYAEFCKAPDSAIAPVRRALASERAGVEGGPPVESFLYHEHAPRTPEEERLLDLIHADPILPTA